MTCRENAVVVIPSLAAALLITIAVAEAQPAQTPAQALAMADRTLACVRAPHADITQSIRLLAEAKTTLESRTVSEAARRDARESIVVLEQRLRDSAAALAACAGPPPSSTHVPVQTEEEPTSPHLAQVSEHVHAGTARVIDGRGHIDPADVQEGLSRLAGLFDACYEGLAERRMIERGDAHLVFVVAGREVRAQTIEGLAIGDATFSQCVARTVRGLRVSRGTTGGDAHVDVVLHFGPE